MADQFTYRNFFVYVQNEMLCTKFKHIIVFLLGNSFRIVLSAVILCLHRCLRHYTSSDTESVHSGRDALNFPFFMVSTIPPRVGKITTNKQANNKQTTTGHGRKVVLNHLMVICQVGYIQSNQ